jgi:release factor glutamine methyltransferase
MRLDGFFALAPDQAPQDIEYLICESLGLSKAALALSPQPDAEQEQSLIAAISLLRSGIPAQYIVGRAWFYGLAFRVNPHVLIPRFDTEVMVEAVQRYLKPHDRVLDLCTGSGIIAITLKHLLPDLAMHASDISPSALAVAKSNAALHKADITFHQADLFPLGLPAFHAIISNPPYISKSEYESLAIGVRDYEPGLALLAGDDGLDFYHRIIAQAAQHLCDEGILALEHGAAQQNDVLHLTEIAGFRTLEIGKDLAARDRYLILQKRG